MTDIHHDLHHDFPEHRELIIKLKGSDAYVEDLKKKRVLLKDQIFHILNKNK